MDDLVPWGEGTMQLSGEYLGTDQLVITQDGVEALDVDARALPGGPYGAKLVVAKAGALRPDARVDEAADDVVAEL
jgi:hypothetical protein